MPDPGHFNQLLLQPLGLQALQIIEVVAPAGQSIRTLGFCLTAFVQGWMIGIDVLLPQQINDVALEVLFLQQGGRATT